MSAEANKRLVRRLVDEAIARRDPEVIDEIATGEFARAAKQWVSPFRSAFPDFAMEVVELIAEGDTVVGHFRCSGTHRGEWLGVPATGRRFEGIDEVYIFRVQDGKLVSAVGVEDNLTRLRQLGIPVGVGAERPGDPEAGATGSDPTRSAAKGSDPAVSGAIGSGAIRSRIT